MDVLQIKALNISRIATNFIGPYERITAENRAENCCCQHVDRNTWENCFEENRLNVQRNQLNEMVGDKTRVGGNKNKTNSAGRNKELRITGELRKKNLAMRERRAIQLSARIVEQLMENLFCALMDLCGAMEQKYNLENRQRKWKSIICYWNEKQGDSAPVLPWNISNHISDQCF